MTKYTVVVAIGRKTHGPLTKLDNMGLSSLKSLSLFRWGQFKTEIENLLRGMDVEIVQRPHLTTGCDQLGTWKGDIEDAATSIGVWKPRFKTDASDLKHGLGQLARRYQQDAITFIIVKGDKHFAYPV